MNDKDPTHCAEAMVVSQEEGACRVCSMVASLQDGGHGSKQQVLGANPMQEYMERKGARKHSPEPVSPREIFPRGPPETCPLVSGAKTML